MATTWYVAGAVTTNSLIALSYGWSMTGSHWRALSYQLWLKKVRSLYLFGPIRNPAAGTPRYEILKVGAVPAVVYYAEWVDCWPIGGLYRGTEP